MAAVAWLALAAVLLPSSSPTAHAFLQPSPWASRGPLRQQGRMPVATPGRESPTALHSFWQGLQELFSPGGSSSGGGGAQQGERPGLTPAEEEAKRRRHFRVYEGADVESIAPYVLGGAAASLPSMDDLWREAWPSDACKTIMAGREDANK